MRTCSGRSIIRGCEVINTGVFVTDAALPRPWSGWANIRVRSDKMLRLLYEETMLMITNMVGKKEYVRQMADLKQRAHRIFYKLSQASREHHASNDDPGLCAGPMTSHSRRKALQVFEHGKIGWVEDLNCQKRGGLRSALIEEKRKEERRILYSRS